jgi:thiamine biosynthesis lipoprotein
MKPIRLVLLAFLGISFVCWPCLQGHAASPHVVKRGQMHMGTLVFLTAAAQDKQLANGAIERGFAEIHRLEEILSTWIPESELSQINAAAGQRAVAASPETIELLEHSLEMARLTEGSFNVAIGPAVEAWNVSREGRVPTHEELESARPLMDLSAIQIDRAAGSVYLARSGMQVDIGGIGKGYAADFAAQVMQEAGAAAGVVAISGDIITFGRLPDGQRFVFGIQHPRKENGITIGQLELEDEAVSTAGDYQRYFEKDGVRYHHILNPQTLRPARLSQSVTIVAKTGVLADGLDTGIFVMGPERGMALIERLPGVEGVIVAADGTVSVSSGLQGRLQLSLQS